MMQKLFRIVKSKEKLPQKEGIYNTIDGRRLFKNGGFYDSIYKAELDRNVFTTVPPGYWFEEIKIPTDEEIENIAANKYPGLPNPDEDEITCRYNLLQLRRKDGFIQGFKAAIKYLTENDKN